MRNTGLHAYAKLELKPPDFGPEFLPPTGFLLCWANPCLLGPTGSSMCPSSPRNFRDFEGCGGTQLKVLGQRTSLGDGGEAAAGTGFKTKNIPPKMFGRGAHRSREEEDNTRWRQDSDTRPSSQTPRWGVLIQQMNGCLPKSDTGLWFFPLAEMGR